MASVQLIKFLDKYLGTFLCTILGTLNFHHHNIKKEYRKIVLIQFWGIGETILTLPAIEELRKHHKNSQIDILVTKRVDKVFYNNKNLSNVRIIDLNLFSILSFMIKNYNRYDITIDMEEYLNISAIIAFFVGKIRIGYNHKRRAKTYNLEVEYNDKQHVSQTFMDLLRPIGIQKKVEELIPVTYPKESEITVNNIFKKLKTKKPVIALSPGAAESSKIRMWPNKKWSELINKINQTKFKGTILLIGAGDVTETNQKILKNVNNTENVFDISGKTDVLGLFALCKKIDLMVSIDSGPMHVAAAQGTPTIGLFGPNTPVRFAPLNNKSISIYKPVAPPVINVHKGQVPNTSGIDHMQKITVKDVFDGFKQLLKK